MNKLFSKLHSLIYGDIKPLSAEETQQIFEQVKTARDTMAENRMWAEVQRDAALTLARKQPKNQQLRNKLKLRLVMLEYMKLLEMNMESIVSRIELVQITADMGRTLQSATQVVNAYKQELPDFAGFVRDLMRTLTPMNKALKGGLEEMTRDLNALTSCDLDGVFSEEDLNSLIDGDTEEIVPVQPVEQTAFTAADSIPSDKDMLASLEERLRRFHESSSADA